jgi:hypothetical protein
MGRHPGVWCGLLVATGACATVQAPESKIMTRFSEGGKVTPAELRIRIHALAGQFSGEFEVLGDDVITSAPDSLSTRMIATRFKMNSIPAMQSALFQPDPGAGLIDAWALLAQLQQGFERAGPLPESTKAHIHKHFAWMEAQIEGIWREVTGRTNMSADRKRIQDWAAGHPLQVSVAARESTASLLASMTAHNDISLLAAAGKIVSDTADLSARLDLESAWLPKQMRWQGEYLALETLTSPTVSKPAADVDRLLTALTHLAETIPSLVDRERMTALSQLRGERLETQRFLDEERRATIEELRGDLKQDLRQERMQAFSDENQVIAGWGTHGLDAATRLVDRMFRWLLLLVGLLVIGGVGSVLLFLRRTPQGPAPRGQNLVERPA